MSKDSNMNWKSSFSANQTFFEIISVDKGLKGEIEANSDLPEFRAIFFFEGCSHPLK